MVGGENYSDRAVGRALALPATNQSLILSNPNGPSSPPSNNPKNIEPIISPTYCWEWPPPQFINL